MNKILGAGALAALALSSNFALAEAESDDPIILTLHDWSSQLVNTKVMGNILERAGYNVEYIPADYIAQFAGLKSGDLHLAMEIWATTGREALESAVATGKVENVGALGAEAVEEWWYPLYMKERCPGLPDWNALRDCADEFSTPETAPSGRYIGAPVTWGGFDEERVEALGLDFEVVHAGTDAALIAELESAYQRKAPVILWLWTPHWSHLKYEGEFVEFPPYSDECYSDPKVGPNPELAYDCGKPRGPIWKAAWSGLKDKWPGAHKIISRYQVSNEDISSMYAMVELEGLSADEAAEKWMSQNEDVWSKWISE